MADLKAAPPVEFVREACGPSWHRHHWRDRWGLLALETMRPELAILPT
jgi:hypothetical protein